MAILSDEHKRFIVTRLAMYDTPQEVADAVKEEFGLVIPRQQVHTYDPERSGKKPAPEWCDLFAVTRKAFLEETARVPIAHRAVRVRELEKLFLGAKRSGNRVLAKDILRQAAEEVGDAYTNRREHSGPGGAPVPVAMTFQRRIVRPGDPVTPAGGAVPAPAAAAEGA